MKFVCSLITVNDMAVSRRFYEELLQLKVQYDYGENVAFKEGIALHTKKHFAGLIDKNPEEIVQKPDNFELYFEEDDIEAFTEKLNAGNIPYVHPLREQPWGQRVVRFYDPDFHIVEVGETMESVARRFMAQGLTAEETARRTYLPLEFVLNVKESENKPMKRYAYKKLDAFASENSSGNPAACLFLEEGQQLSCGEMQLIAAQHKGFVSEVVYCSPTDTSDYDLLYYSSECEVEFCGHGTIACMYSLISSSGKLMKQPELRIKTKRGQLTVYNEIENQNAVYIAAPVPEYLNAGLFASDILSTLEIEKAALSSEYPLDYINAGLNTLIVPICGLSGLISIFPPEEELKAFCLQNGIDTILVFSKETESMDHSFHTRVFCPKFGYLEDPATGSGNSAFGYYLLKHGF